MNPQCLYGSDDGDDSSKFFARPLCPAFGLEGRSYEVLATFPSPWTSQRDRLCGEWAKPDTGGLRCLRESETPSDLPGSNH